MIYGKVIQIFLKYEDPQRLQIIEIKNWTGTAITVTRSHLKDLEGRNELKNPAIYLLLGSNLEQARPSVYVGETENFLKRLKEHLNKDFWNRLIAFVNKDDNLTKAHVQYLEHRVWEILHEANRCELQNGNIPGKGKLSEADQALMQQYIDNIFLILGIIGFPNLNRKISHATSENPLSKYEFFIKINNKGLLARMITDGTDFILCKGSIIKKKTFHEDKRYFTENFIRFRKRIWKSGILQEHEENYRLIDDLVFKSPSSAAMFVLGRSSPGPKEWKTKDGRSYKEIEQLVFNNQ